MPKKHSNHENIDESKNPHGKIREISVAIILFSTLIIKTVFHKQDYDTVFDAGGKTVVIMLLILFFAIYYVQIKKNDKTEK